MIRNRLLRSGFGSALRAQFGAGGSFVPAAGTGQQGQSEELIAAIMAMLRAGQSPAGIGQQTQWASGIPGGRGSMGPPATQPVPQTLDQALGAGGTRQSETRLSNGDVIVAVLTPRGIIEYNARTGQRATPTESNGGIPPGGQPGGGGTIGGGTRTGGIGDMPQVPTGGGTVIGVDASGNQIVRTPDGNVVLVSPDGQVISRSGTQPPASTTPTTPVNTPQNNTGANQQPSGSVDVRVEGNVNPVDSGDYDPGAFQGQSFSGMTNGMMQDWSMAQDVGGSIHQLAGTPSPDLNATIPPEFYYQLPLTDEELSAAGLA